jgi:two-component system, NtrC family, nitrogen regulation sensor histidine kinase NtrY
MKKLIRNNAWLLVAVVSFIISWSLYSVFYVSNIEAETTRFQKSIIELEQKLKTAHVDFVKTVEVSSLKSIWNSKTDNSVVNHYLIKSDSLLYWSDNNVTLEDFLIQHKTSGFYRMKNGFYFLKTSSIGDYFAVSSLKIKSRYAYENEHLQNKLVNDLYLPSDVFVNIETNNGTPIFDSSGEVIFHLLHTGEKNISDNQEIFIFLFYLVGVVSLAIGFGLILNLFISTTSAKVVLYIVALLVFRSVSLINNWTSPFDSFQLFDPNLYASSELLPSLGELIINTVFIGLIVWWVYKQLNGTAKSDSRFSKTLVVLSFILLFPLASVSSFVFKSLIVNSTIGLEIDQLFSLNLYSFITLLVIGIILLLYILVAYKVVEYTRILKLNNVSLLWFLPGVAYFLMEMFYGEAHLFSALWPIILNGVVLLFFYRSKNTFSFSAVILVIAITSIYAAYNLYEHNQLNEFQKRELFAHQLITDRDAATEIEFIDLSHKIRTSAIIERILNGEEINTSEVSSQLMECCLNSFWERYDLRFYVLGSASNYGNNEIGQLENYDYFESILTLHGKPSEFSEELFQVIDNFERLSYVGKIEIPLQGEQLFLYVKIQSKRIPEQIGFPRILINSSAQVMDELENYSIARYFNDELVMRFGGYNFPVVLSALKSDLSPTSKFSMYDGLNHYLYDDKEGNSIVISKPIKTNLENLTNFSYLFLFFSILTLLFKILFFQNQEMKIARLSLSSKVQVVLILLLTSSFVLFGSVTGSFVKNQYDAFTYESIQERLHSVEIEVNQKLGNNPSLDRATLGEYMDYILQKFSKVFATDINLYDLNGTLLSTSQPKLYEKGIVSEQMNPKAFNNLNYRLVSEFIHKENIGELDYLSAYMPFKNRSGNVLGYLNLQHFAKQNAYESQLSGFLVTIINIAVLLLVVTVILALFISNWITQPLRLIQQSIQSIELGKRNSPINYSGNDEIGALVREYNHKLEELEIKAMQLARSERESAWREMAKQVAHEIKNPLTPMKLSLQHFQRSFDPTDPNAKLKIDRISASLVEQINALSAIANEFSNFAKMPKPNEEYLDIVDLVTNTVSIFRNQEAEISVKSEYPTIEIFADRDLMIRVFNNLIKNALQAMPEEHEGLIQIRILKESKFVQVEVEDNGIGISEDEKQKIFIPNFTTKTTGAGLGLAMVKQIISNHSGDIWFETKEDVGTTFFVRLPIGEEK